MENPFENRQFESKNLNFFSSKTSEFELFKVEIFLPEISTANRNFRLRLINRLKTWKKQVKFWSLPKVSHSVGWPYKARSFLLDVQTFVEKKNHWNRTRIGHFHQKNFWLVRTHFFTSEKIDQIWETKNSSFCPVMVLSKSERSSKVVVGNIERPKPNYSEKVQLNPQHKCNFSHVCIFILFRNGIRKTTSPFSVTPYFGKLHAKPKKNQNWMNVPLKGILLFFWWKKTFSFI